MVFLAVLGLASAALFTEANEEEETMNAGSGETAQAARALPIDTAMTAPAETATFALG